MIVTRRLAPSICSRSLEGREVDILTITDIYGASSECEAPLPPPHRESWEGGQGALGGAWHSHTCAQTRTRAFAQTNTLSLAGDGAQY